jgi:hypothetical protein
MSSLPPEAARQVKAAMGWLELGDHLEANEELERIEPGLRGHPEVLDVRWRIYAAAGKWATAVEPARVVMKLAPQRRVETRYALAVAACRLKRLDDARRWLGAALDVGGKTMKLRALDDPALAEVWRGG